MRQTGWYRVKIYGKWEFAEYYGGEWFITAADATFQDSAFQEINEELQNPEPPKKTGLDGDGYPIEVK